MEPISAHYISASTITVAAVVVLLKVWLRWQRGAAQSAPASVGDLLSGAALVPFLLLGYSAMVAGQAEILLRDFSLLMALAGLIAVIHMLFQLWRL